MARPLLDNLLPEHLRPVPLRSPKELAEAVERYRDLRDRRKGRPLGPGDDPLAVREQWSALSFKASRHDLQEKGHPWL